MILLQQKRESPTSVIGGSILLELCFPSYFIIQSSAEFKLNLWGFSVRKYKNGIHDGCRYKKGLRGPRKE